MLVAISSSDVIRMYFVTKRDGVDYNLAYMGSDFEHTKTGEFDQAYMQALYAYGRQQILSGHAWHKVPPGIGQPAGVPPR